MEINEQRAEDPKSESCPHLNCMGLKLFWGLCCRQKLRLCHPCKQKQDINEVEAYVFVHVVYVGGFKESRIEQRVAGGISDREWLT